MERWYRDKLAKQIREDKEFARLSNNNTEVEACNRALSTLEELDRAGAVNPPKAS